jgi:hypothetical protein
MLGSVFGKLPRTHNGRAISALLLGVVHTEAHVVNQCQLLFYKCSSATREPETLSLGPNSLKNMEGRPHPDGRRAGGGANAARVQLMMPQKRRTQCNQGTTATDRAPGDEWCSKNARQSGCRSGWGMPWGCGSVGVVNEMSCFGAWQADAPSVCWRRCSQGVLKITQGRRRQSTVGVWFQGLLGRLRTARGCG